ncbi:MAG: hypothetical protein ACKOEP_06380 [Phycisphaerales bacterium]
MASAARAVAEVPGPLANRTASSTQNAIHPDQKIAWRASAGTTCHARATLSTSTVLPERSKELATRARACARLPARSASPGRSRSAAR